MSANRSLKFSYLTLFPEVFEPFLESSLLGKACEKGLISFDLVQIRDFATDKHHTVDDTPYGGGEGMVLKADVLHAAWLKAKMTSPADNKELKTLTVMTSPQGEVFNQDIAKELVQYDQVIFVCGHYEGVDERFIEGCVDRELSIGDYVLTGGELPAMVMTDAIARWVPGVVGNERSVSLDSLEGGLLKYPQYTRPRDFQGALVPDVLLGGDHGAIARWRQERIHERTAQKRPDLWKRFVHRGLGSSGKR